MNAVFHDPAAALVVDGEIVAAAEEERFSRRKHGKQAVPFSTWEMPERSARWCLEAAGIGADELDAVTYSYEPALLSPPPAPSPPGGRTHSAPATPVDVTVKEWEPLRTLFAAEAPGFLRTVLPGLDPEQVRFVPHHVAHAASAYLAAPIRDGDVLVLDGRGEIASHLAGRALGGELEVLAATHLPHSLGLMYEELTEHLGFHRSSDEYKVMAMASYAEPVFLEEIRQLVRPTEGGCFEVEPIAWEAFAKPRRPDAPFAEEHAQLASSVQHRLEEVLLDLARWLHGQTTGGPAPPTLTMAGGVALNCVANSRLAKEGPYERIWVQPAAGDSGTALGGALYVSRELGDDVSPMTTAALGRDWSEDELGAWLEAAAVPHERPARPAALAEAVAEELAGNAIVAWFEGRSEYGPRALGHRSLFADPRRAGNLHRLNAVKGREQFRPVAPMVTLERAAEIFDGPLPSPYMLFTHRIRPGWAERIPAVVHVDGTARAQTVDPESEPLVHGLLRAFERRTGVPVLVNTSLNTAGRPMVDDPRDALECFGSSPVDVLVLGPFVVRRSTFAVRRSVTTADESPVTTR